MIEEEKSEIAKLQFPYLEKKFKLYFEDIQKVIHITAKEKGWWDERDELLEKHKEFVIATVIALAHSELSEALESARHGYPSSEQIPSRGNFEVELADVIIRIMDLSERLGIDLAGTIIDKMKYNATREYKHGGKAI